MYMLRLVCDTAAPEMVENQRIAPRIPVWKVLTDGQQRVSLNTYAQKIGIPWDCFEKTDDEMGSFG